MTKKPHPVDVHVGNTLRRLRCYAGLSQVALAESVGITFQQLQKYEAATNRISASRLWELAQELGAPVESLFPLSSDTRPSPFCQGDPGFAQWVRIYRETPEDSRASLLKVAKVIANERL